MPIANELTINTAATAEDMLNEIFGDGITLVAGTATYSGDAAASGIYSDAITTLGGISPTDSGVILSTGNAVDFTNSDGTLNTNTAPGTSTDLVGGIDGNANMDAVSGQATFDAAILEGDFIPTGDTMTIQLVFSSEEYLEYVNGGVNDSLGLYINGVKVDFVLGTGNVSIDEITNTNNSNLYIDNPEATDPYNTEMDGMTVVLTYKADVNPGVVNTFFLGIADGGDAAYDSNVLIMADSVQSVAIANDDTFSVPTNSTVLIAPLANDDDLNGGGLTITQINGEDIVVGQTVTLGTGEQVTLNADNTLTVITDGDVGVSSLTYTVDNGAGTTDVGIIQLDVTATPTNDNVVTGTAGNDAIGSTYTDADGTQQDGTDALGTHGEVVSSNDDSIFAAGGDDVVNAGLGNDTVDAGTGNDTVFGEGGNDSIIGGLGNDSLDGDAGADSLYGGDGSDTLIGDAGNDVMIGGDGADEIYDSNAADGGRDYVELGAGNDVAFTGADNDTIYFGEGNDTVNAGDGNDLIDDVAGTQILGDDSVFGGAGSDTVFAGDGADTLDGGTGADSLWGEDGNDSITGGDGNDTILGGSGVDTVDGGTGDDSITLGDGNDTYLDGAGNDIIDGGEGKDRFDYTTITGNDTVIGGELNDTTPTDSGDKLDAHNSVDNLTVVFTGDEAGTMTDGTDTVTFSEIEHIMGGQGTDSIDASASTVQQILDGGEGSDTIQGGSGDDIIAMGQTQDFSATDGDNDTLVLADGFGDDSIEGFETPIDNGDGTFTGQDQLDVTGLTDAGGSPVNVLDVTVTDTNGDGTGDAILQFPNGESITLWGVNVSEVSSDDQLIAMGIPPIGPVDGTAGGDLMQPGYVDAQGDIIDGADGDVDTIFGYGGNDTIDGGNAGDTIDGGAGDDTLRGQLGDDSVIGGAGNDTIRVTDGNDTVEGGDDADLIVVTEDAGTVSVDGGAGGTDSDTLDVSTVLETSGYTITATGDESGTATHSSGTSISYSDIETLQGSSNDDLFDLTADTDGAYAIGGEGADTMLGGDAGDNLRGRIGDDSIDGGAGDDTLDGGTGSDTIIGGSGADSITADEDADTIILENGFGNDTIFGGEGVTTGADDDTLDMSGITTDTTVDLTSVDPEAGSVSSGSDTATFSEIENIVLGGGRDTIVLADGSGSDTVQAFDLTDSGDGTTNDQLDVSGLTSDGGTTPVDTDDVTVTDDGSGNAVLTFPGGESITLLGVAPTDVDDREELVAIGIPGAPNFIVDGTSGNDSINLGTYVDAEGEEIDNSDHSDGSNDDSVLAGDGDDFVRSHLGDDTVFGGLGNDTIRTDTGADSIFGEDGADSIDAGDDNDFIDGGTGNDNIDLGWGDDTVVAGDGNDTVWGDNGNDSVDGGAGDDSIQVGPGADTIIGGAGNDSVRADGDEDVMVFADGYGNDTVIGGESATTGTDFDSLDLSLVTAGSTIVYSGFEAGTVTTGTDSVLFSQIERIETGAGDDTVTGTFSPENIATGAGNDTLNMGGGDDTIEAGAGADTVDAGEGADTVDLGTDGDRDIVVFSDGDGADTVSSFDLTDSGDGTTIDQLDVSGLTSDGGTTPVNVSDVTVTDDGSGNAVLTFPGGESITLLGVAPTQVDSDAELEAIGIPNDPNDNVVSGTAGADNIGAGYSDADGTTVDDGDALGTHGEVVGSDSDSIAAGAGNDTVNAGAGDDTVSGGNDDDQIDGGIGDDWLSGNAGNDTVHGGDGADSIFGAEGDDSLTGGAGDDSMEGWLGNDTLQAGDGNDYLDGADGSDFLTGGAGNDTLLGGNDAGADTLEGGAGQDSLSAGDGDDQLVGGDDADTIFAGGGDDTIIMEDGFGNDTIDGWSTGETTGDVLDGSKMSEDVVLDLSAGDPSNPEDGTLSNATDTATFIEIEEVWLGAGDDSVIGSDGNDNVSTGAGIDTVDGGAGNDTFDLGPADNAVDTVVFGDGDGDDTVSSFEAPTDNGDGTFSGNDQLDVSGLTDADGAPVNTGDVTVTDTNGDGTGDAILTFPNGESITLLGVTPSEVDDPAALEAMGIPAPNYIVEGTAGGELIDGSYVGDPEGDLVDAGDNQTGGDADVITAGAGADTVLGELGNDTIFGEDGNDSIAGGEGQDSISGGLGNDYLVGGNDSGTFGTSGDAPAALGADTIDGGDGNDTIIGNNGDDSLIGGAGNDSISGQNDNDTILAGDGADTVDGGSGLDSIDAGAGDDSVIGGGGADTIDGGIGVDTIDGGIGNDLIFGNEDEDLLSGGAGNDTLDGGLSSDTLIGGDGNDSLLGGGFNDSLEGGTGNDTLDGGIEDDTLAGGAGTDSLIGGTGDDVMTGGSEADTLEGGDGADLLDGGLDDDSILGGAQDDTISLTDNFGNDTIEGGEVGETAGDTLDLSGTTTGVTVDLTSTDPEAGSVSNGIDTTTFIEIENIVLGGGDDTVALADGSGSDTVSGFEGPIDNGDGTWTGQDQLDVSGLNNDNGFPVTTADVVVTDDGTGNAVLTFPNGESITLFGAPVGDLQGNPVALNAIGIPLSDGIISGDGTANVINASYSGDPEGDMVDAGDNVDGSGNNEDTIVAGAGDDTIDSGLDDDSVDAGAGDDVIFLDGAVQNDTIVGGETDEDGGGDRIEMGSIATDLTINMSGPEAGTISDGTGTTTFSEIEQLTLGAGSDSLTGSTGNEYVFGGTGDDTILGGDGDDTIFSGLDNDSVEGGAGNDSLVTSSGADTVDGGAGDDNINVGPADGEVDTVVLQDGSGNDVVADFEGPIDNGDGTYTGQDQFDVSGLNDNLGNPVNTNDVVVSDDGSGNAVLTFPNGENVTLVGIAPADVTDPLALNAMGIPLGSDGIVSGTAGDDTIGGSYVGDPDGDLVDANDAQFAGQTGDQDIIQAGAGNDVVNAGNDADSIDGGTGNDTISGGDGNDTIDGGEGDDFILSNNGDDTVFAGDGNDTVTASLGADSVLGGAGDDSLTGGGFSGTGNDTLRGEDGSDTLAGGLGDDLLDGGADNDVFDLNGSADNDTIIGGETVTTGTDQDLIEAGGETLDTTVTYTGDEAGTFTNTDTTVTFSEIEAINLGSGADSVDGTSDTVGINVFGAAGDDTMTGGTGNDTLLGGDDNDSIVGGDGADQLDGDAGDDTVEGGTGDDTLVGDLGNDSLDGGAGADELYGNEGSDTLTGGEGADLLFGGEGADVLNVGSGDTAQGGGGDDVFNLTPGDLDGNNLTIVGGETGETVGDTLNVTGPAEIVYDDPSQESGTITYYDTGEVVTFSEIENLNYVPCFTPGTKIKTAQGEMPVEEITVGTRVLTRDNGYQPVIWAGSRLVDEATMAKVDGLKPILIKKDALAKGVPSRDLLVSPQHRVLIGGSRTELWFGEDEVLVPAKHLLVLDGVEEVDLDEVTYVHFMFEHHEVVISDGCWTESFQPGDVSLSALDAEARAEIFAIFPELKKGCTESVYPAARATLKEFQIRVLLAS
ncbi:Hint domain-containing protein [Thalassococcus lentus]|uniref:Hint domain-containing protein n=1 Tax=Thalassococcus lentus TaxID=1210524 RepID=A0ABT4XUJ8_9RHOB|nr:Hint domain-containing protein [Thalassococcus lentus]MDA7425634.1 Hint domain-containing protein [Thalassococcus lentus]